MTSEVELKKRSVMKTDAMIIEKLLLQATKQNYDTTVNPKTLNPKPPPKPQQKNIKVLHMQPKVCNASTETQEPRLMKHLCLGH